MEIYATAKAKMAKDKKAAKKKPAFIDQDQKNTGDDMDKDDVVV